MKNLRTELMLYFTIVVTVILVVIGEISSYQTKKTVELRVSESTVETLKQINKNLDYIWGDIQDISLFVVANKNIRNYCRMDINDLDKIADTLLTLNEEFANLTNSKRYIFSINIYGENGLNFETAGPSQVQEDTMLKDIEKRIPKDGNFLITPVYKRNYQSMGERYIISFYRQINDINNFSRKLGYLRIDVNEEEVNNIYKQIKLGDTGYIFMINKEGYVVLHSDKSELRKNIKDESYFSYLFKEDEGYYHENIDGVDTLITYYTSKDGEIIFIGMVPFNELLKEVQLARRLKNVLIMTGSFLALIISYFVAKKITYPIKKLTRLMKKVEEGDLDVVINVDRKDEIGILGQSFNRMISELKTLIEEVYKNQIIRKEAQLRALQAQINPHFLYNTLDVIYWTSRMENAPKTGEIVNALAKLFRLGLNRGSEITTIGKEIEHLQNYLIIQKVRYDEEPKIEINIPSELYKFKTIKLLLQPLVENALIHGIADLEERGRILVSGRLEGAEVVIEVADNGAGMDEERAAEILQGEFEEKKGYGLKNVNERIKLYFGEQYGIKVFSQKDVGTVVEIRFPKVSGIGGTEPDDKTINS
ncbi:sensor histidine kinase [Clostridium thermarum]|uniref:sensor histidine kinase n=1 Tax=Clostridium thermarum TaxID=1716543 RepID=UPI001124A9D1|nr:sensor histidine kinase [Clostridium thermarum]